MNAPDHLVVLWTFADKETMPATVAAHTKKSRNFVSGAPRWMDGERIEYIRRDPAVILAAALEGQTVENLAFVLWKAEADRAAPNVGKTRTPEGFAEQTADTRERWLFLARAALKPDATTRKRKPRQPEPTPSGRPAPFTSAELEARMDAICGCSGQHDCDCVSIYNRATAELWTEKNALKPDAKKDN
jgi:hypothetical protein